MKQESKIQQEIYIWFHNNYPNYIIHSVPNGIGISIPKNKVGKFLVPEIYHHIIYGAIKKAVDLLKQTGLVPGVSDLIIHLPNGKCVMVEVKDEKNDQQPAQKKIEAKMIAMGSSYILVRSLEDFKEQIKQFIL